MPRERWLIAIAVAVLCAGGVALWWLGMQPPPERAQVRIGTGGVDIDENDSPSVHVLTEKDSAKELDGQLDAYLAGEKQAYGDASRDYLDLQQRADLKIPLPPVEPMPNEVPALLPIEPTAPTERP